MTTPIVHIVDDDLSIGKALGRLLKSIDFKYEYFASAEEYLKNTNKEKAHCLILDIKLPGMSGMELQQELKKRMINIPIVFITGHGDAELEETVMNAGAFGYLEKPFDEKVLVNLIKLSCEHRTIN
ncbi:MAG: response regulator [Desulfobulbaceae bacterium]|nr:response regulator [Desulfobulbaceae bacterium]